MNKKTEILEDIKAIAGTTNHGEEKLAQIAPLYTELQIIFSSESENQHNANLAIQKKLNCFTIWLIALTIALFILGVAQLILTYASCKN